MCETDQLNTNFQKNTKESVIQFLAIFIQIKNVKDSRVEIWEEFVRIYLEKKKKKETAMSKADIQLRDSIGGTSPSC